MAAENKNLHTTHTARNLTKHGLYIKVARQFYQYNRYDLPRLKQLHNKFE